MQHSGNLSARPCVVVVDDDAAVRESLQFSLQIEGFAVCTYPGPAALLSDSRFAGCDCLIVDQAMSEMTGLELIAALRARGLAAPAILITSHPSVAVRERAARAGVPIVEKPLLNSALGDRIRQLLAQPPA